MSLKIFDDSQNYTAQVIKLPVKQPVQGLDNLVEVNVFGNSCLVGKDSPENQLYLFFPAGTQLSEAFVKGNNLYREQQANADISQKGFFELNRRVKAIKFRGIISSGFVIPLQQSLDGLLNGIDAILPLEFDHSLKEGDSFNEIDGMEVCRKYQLPINKNAQGGGDKANKINSKLANLLIPNQFRFHNETSHLANNLHLLNPDDIIVITDKWHGSSCILSKVLIKKKLNRWQKFFKAGLKLFLNAEISDKDYGYVYSSGKPKSNLPKGIIGSWINDGPDYYTTNIWKHAMDDYKQTLEDGISLYGELVGYTEGGSFIQKGYDYNCDPEGAKYDTKDNYRFVIYRITYTKPDGTVIEFSWQQIKEYCKKYSLETVKELYFGRINALYVILHLKDVKNNTFIFPDGWKEHLFQMLQKEYNLEQKCTHCTTGVPAEGITLRIDGKQSYSTYKLKSKLFLKKESDDLDKGETNIEDNP